MTVPVVDHRPSGCLRCGEPLPPSRTKPRKWCSENCRRRASEERHRRYCAGCGDALPLRSSWAQNGVLRERCETCHRKREHAARRARIEDVAAMYNDDMSYAEIAAELGYGPNSHPPEITEARRLGLLNGYRCEDYGEAAGGRAA